MHAEFMERLAAGDLNLLQAPSEDAGQTGRRMTLRPDANLDLIFQLGRFLAKALFDGNLVADVLCSAVLKVMVLGRDASLTLDDMAEVDSIADHWLTMLVLPGVAEALTEDFDGLEPNGAARALTEANKRFWVERKVRVGLYETRKAAMDKLREGFLAAATALHIAEQVSALLANISVLRDVLCGLRAIRSDQLATNLRFDRAFSPQFQQRMREVVSTDFTAQHCALFVRHVTGAPGLASGAFIWVSPSLPHPSYLPTVHTCFAQIDMHPTWSKDQIRERLTQMLRLSSEASAFGIR